MGYLFGKRGFLLYLYSVIKKHKNMRTITIIEHVEKKIILAHYSRNEDEAINWFNANPLKDEWNILHMDTREKSGHRYELEAAKFDECGELYSKYIICFSKKEALYLKELIRKINPEYLFSIKKIY